MATGDVTAEIIDLNTTTLESTIETMRNSANDKWLMTTIGPEGKQVLVVNIEEA